MKTYFKCEVSYVKNNEIDDPKLVSEQYLVEAISYTDAETAIHKNMEEILGQNVFTVKKIEKAKIHEIIDIDGGAETFWLAKTSFIATSDKGAEKKVVENVLVNANSAKQALEKLLDKFKDGAQAVTTRIVGLTETTILEIFPC
jgi:hypothetical protein